MNCYLKYSGSCLISCHAPGFISLKLIVISSVIFTRCKLQEDVNSAWAENLTAKTKNGAENLGTALISEISENLGRTFFIMVFPIDPWTLKLPPTQEHVDRDSDLPDNNVPELPDVL